MVTEMLWPVRNATHLVSVVWSSANNGRTWPGLGRGRKSLVTLPPNKVEQTGSTLGLSEIRTAYTPPVHIIHRKDASLSPLIHSQCQLQV